MNERERTGMDAVGIWSFELRGAARPEAQEAAAELDALGFSALWIPGLDGAGALDDLGPLLHAAPRAHVALGILSIWGQDPEELGRRLDVLDRAHGPRALLGLGVSNAHAAATHGQVYAAPVQTLGRYLDRLDAAVSPVPVERRFLGALGPRMADLAASRTAGWHPFLVTPDYVASHRARVGAAPLIAPHQAVVLDQDPDRARDAARAGVGPFLGLPTYQANLRRLGFSDDDFLGGGSDRLIDAVTAHGDLDDVVRRVRDHLDAGADHVALHVVRHGSDPAAPDALPLPQWRELATTLPVLASR